MNLNLQFDSAESRQVFTDVIIVAMDYDGCGEALTAHTERYVQICGQKVDRHKQFVEGVDAHFKRLAVDETVPIYLVSSSTRQDAHWDAYMRSARKRELERWRGLYPHIVLDDTEGFAMYELPRIARRYDFAYIPILLADGDGPIGGAHDDATRTLQRDESVAMFRDKYILVRFLTTRLSDHFGPDVRLHMRIYDDKESTLEGIRRKSLLDSDAGARSSLSLFRMDWNGFVVDCPQDEAGSEPIAAF